MRRCISLAEESYAEGDLPFGALVVKGSEIVAEAKNTGLTDVTGHAEINAIKKAVVVNPNLDFSDCTLYTNFEPCAMCAFIIRDLGFGRVVFAVESPHLGGYSKWDILNNDTLRPEFTSRKYSKPSQISGGILRDEAVKIFESLNWRMHLKDE